VLRALPVFSANKGSVARRDQRRLAAILVADVVGYSRLMEAVMQFEFETLDDVLLELYSRLLSLESNIKATRGDFSELLGVSIEIQKPRARLSRSETRGKGFSSLGELLWYLTGDNRLDFIEKYIGAYRKESEDGVTVYGGYGPRLFQQRGNDQLRNVTTLLRARPTSRRAVIQIFNAEDIAQKHEEIPCTTTLQFLIRDERVHLIVTMRSNDAYLGLPHDVFCFTMLQEIVARMLDQDIGTYRHFVGSMHLYEKDRASAERLVAEGFQSRIEMPPMPAGDPWPSISSVLGAESRIRKGELFNVNQLGLDAYWSDLVIMLQIFFCDDVARKETLSAAMSNQRYRPYISSRIK
jgi:thymidylate synthase